MSSKVYVEAVPGGVVEARKAASVRAIAGHARLALVADGFEERDAAEARAHDVADVVVLFADNRVAGDLVLDQHVYAERVVRVGVRDLVGENQVALPVD